MSIRVKLLIALLVATLFPLAYAAFVGFQSTVSLSRGVAADQRSMLLDDARGTLVAAMRKNLEIFQMEAGAYYAANALQAVEAQRVLSGPPPEDPSMYTPDAFREGGIAPGLGPSDQHEIVQPDGTTTPALLSFAEPAIYLAPGAAAGDGERLATLTPLFRSLRPALSRSAYWQFITLESGVHLVYPGHGLLPDDYDGREAPAYELAARRQSGGGSPPSVDPATGAVLVGMTAPVRDQAGRAIGQTGVLARVDAMIRGFEIGTEWGASAETYFVAVTPDAGGVDRAMIIAKRAYARDGSGAGFISVDRFEADDPADTEAVIEACRTAEIGSRIVSVGGEQMICCYGGVRGDRIGLVTLVPVESAGMIADAGAEQIRGRALTQLVGILIGVVVFGLAMSFAAILGSRAITRPIHALVSSMKRVSSGDLDVRAEVMTRDEIGELAETFNAMVPRLRDHVRMRQSLDLAQQVQRGLLPGGPPRVAGLDVAGVSIYCDETGGDYYDFMDFDQPSPGRLTIAVGDVTGHGVAAALLMATARALIRMRAALPGALGEHLADINRHLSRDAGAGRFMTLMLLSLDREALEARWVGAGHDPVLLYDPEADAFRELAGEDIPLGLEEEWEFQERTADGLAVGQVLLIGTDGIWEAFDEADKQYGKQRLRDCLRRHAGLPAAKIAAAVLADVGDFRGECPQHDDVTMVVVKITAI